MPIVMPVPKLGKITGYERAFELWEAKAKLRFATWEPRPPGVVNYYPAL